MAGLENRSPSKASGAVSRGPQFKSAPYIIAGVAGWG